MNMNPDEHDNDALRKHSRIEPPGDWPEPEREPEPPETDEDE